MDKRIYFKNLNALRFIAAIAVIFHHIEQYKYWAKIPSAWGNVFVDALGQKAISFFFVLSGFLITYLLLEEGRITSHISVKNFYIRRILRIWPVYYLVVLLCLFVVPNVFDLSLLGIDTYDSKFVIRTVLLLFVLPNLLRIYSPSLAGGNQLWSIGVEEQFYIIWPLLVRSFVKKFLKFLLVFIAIKIGLTILLDVLTFFNDGLVLSAIFRFWVLLKMEQMAIGAIGAWILFERKESIIHIIHHRVTWVLSLVALAGLMVLPIHHWIISYVEAVIFLLVIVNLSTNPSIKFSMENPLLNRLGNISYGIYMYHTLCIMTCFYALNHFKIQEQNQVVFNILFYAGSVVLTIVTAYFSYEYFEKGFLSLKEKFMIVKSGTDSTEAPLQEKVSQKV